jgi:GNAT superfamily N-acetyltransferase
METPILIRPYTEADIPQLLEVQRECFPPPYPEEQLWQPEQLLSHIAIFPEGALCAVLDGKIVGSCTNLIIAFDPAHPQHTWAEVSDNGYIRTHNPRGNTLYGIDIAVRPAYRGRGIARRFYQARFDLVVRLGLERFLTAGRMPGYHRYAAEMDVEEYAAKVIAGELTDPVITPQLRAGLQPVAVVREYIPDEESGNSALMLEWRNANWR